MDLKLLQTVLEDKDTRREYFRHDFEMWESFYFKRDQAGFHLDWNKSLESMKDMLLVGFRGSGKTTKVQNYVAWCLLHVKEPYIIVQSYEDTLSSAWVREVAKILMNPAIVEDYGCIYPLNRKIEDLAKGGQSSFETTNGCKIESRGIGGTIRGANAGNKNGKKTRPTLLVLDDIDVTKSVANERIIEQNYDKIISETMGALDQTHRRVILLGNVINEDGVVPRFRRTFADTWDIFWQPLIDEHGDCVWPERFTTDIIEKLRSEGERAFGQNYLLIPFTGGDTIIKRTSIKYATEMPAGARRVIGIDPAFSEKTGTDEMGIGMTGHVGVNKYVQIMEGLSGTEKDEERFCSYVEGLYKKWNVAMIVVEENNGGLILARMLKKRNLSVMTKKAIKDKVTRLREYEGCFDRGEVFFLPGTEKGVDQLLSFPHGAHDDRCLVGDTLIETEKGKICIKDVKEGDFVLTRKGYRKVLKSFCTGMKDVKKVKFSNGGSIIGTWNHPVYIKEKGFVTIDAIVYGDILETCQQYKNTIELLSGTTLKANNLHTEGISKHTRKTKLLSYICIGIFGKSITDLFRKIVIYTIKTVTHLIMIFQTWSVWKNLCIGVFTGQKRGESGLVKIGKTIIKKCRRLQKNGDTQKSEKLGIDNMQLTDGRKKYEVKKYAEFVEKNTNQYLKDEDFVVVTVSHKTGVIGKRKVYNLEVEDCHEYFANGVLVHNCDAMVYSFEKSGGIAFGRA